MAQKQKKNKKWLFWAIIVLLFVVAAVVCYFVWDGYFKKKEDNDESKDQPVQDPTRLHADLFAYPNVETAKQEQDDPYQQIKEIEDMKRPDQKQDDQAIDDA